MDPHAVLQHGLLIFVLCHLCAEATVYECAARHLGHNKEVEASLQVAQVIRQRNILGKHSMRSLLCAFVLHILHN
jgi:hypothetical protein